MPKPKISKDDAAGWRKEARKLRKALEELTIGVQGAIWHLDKILEADGSCKGVTGSKAALILNSLEVCNDSKRYSALGIDFRKDTKDDIRAVFRASKVPKPAARNRNRAV